MIYRDHATLTRSFLKFQIHDGYDGTGNTLIDTLKLDMHGDATIFRNILLNGSITGMTNIYTKTEVDTIIANNPGPQGSNRTTRTNRSTRTTRSRC